MSKDAETRLPKIRAQDTIQKSDGKVTCKVTGKVTSKVTIKVTERRHLEMQFCNNAIDEQAIRLTSLFRR